MCLIIFSLNQHPQYKLILVANRDEFYARKTEPAAYWPHHSNILGGRDLEAVREDGTYGTWMAVTTSGKIAMVTNYRDFNNLKSKAPSRGHLVSDFLIQDMDPGLYLKKIEQTKHLYNGFNLMLGDADQLHYLSNYKNNAEILTAGFYGLSNHLLQTAWPKVSLAKEQLKPLMEKPEINVDEILDVMKNETRARDETLPETGIGVERERALSSMFIKTDGYGTRCTTALLVSRTNRLSFIERTYDLNNFSFSSKKFVFAINK